MRYYIYKENKPKSKFGNWSILQVNITPQRSRLPNHVKFPAFFPFSFTLRPIVL